MFTRKQLQERRKSWKAKDRYSGESMLLVLPCNAGGPQGSYFKGSNCHNLWTHCSYYLREWRDDLVFAAVDNAVAWMPGRDDGLGAGEFEWEVSRAASSFDAGVPTANRFDAAKMQLFVDSLQVLCQRIKGYGFQKVYVILTPLAYRTAFMKAAELEGLKVVLFAAARCGVANVAAQLLRCMLLKNWWPNESVLVTHEVLRHVPLPKVPIKWNMTDPITSLRVVDLDGVVDVIQGKYGKYYVDGYDSYLLPTETVCAKYLIPVDEGVLCVPRE